MKDKSKKYSLLKLLRSEFGVIKKCPICEKEFEESKINILDFNTSKQIIHSTCSNCKHSLVFILENTDIGGILIGILSDLSLEDVKKFTNKKEFDENDLLESYSILHFKQKDFIKEIIK